MNDIAGLVLDSFFVALAIFTIVAVFRQCRDLTRWFIQKYDKKEKLYPCGFPLTGSPAELHRKTAEALSKGVESVHPIIQYKRMLGKRLARQQFLKNIVPGSESQNTRINPKFNKEN